MNDKNTMMITTTAPTSIITAMTFPVASTATSAATSTLK